MSRLLLPLLFLLALAAPAAAEPGHAFPPLGPDEQAKIQAALPHAVAKPAKPRRLLVFFLTEGYVHASIPYANEAFKEIGEKTGAFTADFSEDMGVFTPEKLAAYDAILFNSTTGLKFTDPAARAALLGFVRAGKGIVGVHAATDNFPTWEDGRALMGGAFDGHPWGAGDLEAVQLDDPGNPVVAPFGGQGFWLRDEIYQMKAPYDRSLVRELLSLDMSRPENARPPEKIHRTDRDFPICWIKRTDGGGRVFYCSLGHNPSIFWTPQILQMYLNGVQFALGDLPLDTTPTGALPPLAASAPPTPAPINEKPSSARPGPPPPSPVVGAPAVSADTLASALRAVASYEDGADRTALVAFDTLVRTRPGDRPGVEAALLPLLARDDVSVGAKDYVCRWLGVIGSDTSVPALRKLIDDPKLSQLAVTALFVLRTPAARAALLDGLATAPAPLRPALIGALGRAEAAEAVPALAKAAASADPAEAVAALDALGIIGTRPALEALRAAPVPAPLENARQWARLHAADKVLAEGAAGRDLATPVFAALLQPGTSAALRIAAASRCVRADPAGAAGVLLPLLKDDDARVRSGAVRLAPLLAPDGIKTLAGALAALDPATQAGIVNLLAEKRPAGIEPVLQAALASTSSEVQLAAVAGYGAANLPDSMTVLLPMLARGGGVAASASTALEKLSPPDADARLKETLSADAPAPVRSALLTILAARQDHSALDLFLAAAGDPNPVVATAAFQAVEAVAGGGDLDRVAGLFPLARTSAERKSVANMLLHCARSAPDKDRAADFLIDGIQKAAPDARSVLIAAIASVPSAKAAGYLQAQLAAPTTDARKDAIRALCTARTPAGDKLLLQAASQGAEPTEKILALRGYLDGIQTPSYTDPQRIEAYKTAWPLAIRQEERQAILDALHHLKGREAQKAFDELSAQAAKSA